MEEKVKKLATFLVLKSFIYVQIYILDYGQFGQLIGDRNWALMLYIYCIRIHVNSEYNKSVH